MAISITTDRAAAELLSRLVAIPSVTLGVDQGTGEAAMADTVEEIARSAGSSVTRQEVLPGRPNVICTVAADAPGPHLLLEAHMDTVALGPMVDGHRPRIDEAGLLHGRGACDTKGSLAAMLLALEWAADVAEPPGPLTLLAAVDEETGSAGADAFGQSDHGVAAAIVGEPTSLDIVRVHRGGGHWRVVTRGTAAHSSIPELGDNAIFRMADVIQVIREEFGRRLANRSHPLVGQSSFSVGRITGGRSFNMVPDQCELIVERRQIPGESAADVESELEAVLDVARAQYPELRVELVSPVVFAEVLDIPEEAPIVHAARDAATAVLGAANVIGVAYGSDAAILANAGIPSVLCGPGDITYAHTADEVVPITEVVQAAAIYAQAWMGFSDAVSSSRA
jgi:succinyl-diaminopimelate desuccinylase